MNTNKINQKEYLKKYLAGDKSESKKSKKKKSVKKEKSTKNITINIVDDDIDLSQVANINEAELDCYNLGEDLPQIAGIIDERPAELIAKEDYKTSQKWKSLGDNETGTTNLLEKYDTTDRNSNQRRKRSPDTSPPRRSKRSSDKSSPRRSKRSPDTSPPRRSKRSPDTSPPRRSKRSPDRSPPRRSKRSPDTSPPRRSKRSPDTSSLRRSIYSSHRNNASPLGNSEKKLKMITRTSDSPPPTHKKMVKTLEGKVAGLQDAKALREENEQFRKREEEIFERIQEKQKHEDNEGVVRNRKTGRQRRLHEDDKKDEEKLKKEEERKQIYERWGKGLKQIENYKEQIASENHEMSKPMARYANDSDLEDFLRNQCREGDPMASYFRKKTNDLQSGPCKPIYQGSFPENRFNIRPGYRWDGVDRTNGYEKKWFNVLNQKKAVEEEAYKYSVEDM